MSPLPLSLFAMISIAGCAPMGAHEPPPGADAAPEPELRVGSGPEDGACRAEAAQRFVGRMPDEETVRAAMTASGAATVRVIAHDAVATMDYRGDRLNLRLDESGRIAAVACG